MRLGCDFWRLFYKALAFKSISTSSMKVSAVVPSIDIIGSFLMISSVEKFAIMSIVSTSIGELFLSCS